MKSLLTILLLFAALFATGQRSNTFDVGSQFIPAGYMGCHQSIIVQQAWTINPRSGPICFRISMTASCPAGFAGVYWTNRAGDSGANWGQYPGMNLSGNRFTRLTFWARGENGGEVVEFGCGGINNMQNDPVKFTHRDSFHKVIEGRVVVLGNTWRQYSIDVRNQDLSSVIGGFYWVSNWTSNPSGLIFYLDDVRFER